MPRLNTNRIKDSTKEQVRIFGVPILLGKRKQFRYFICTMSLIHFDIEKISHDCKSTVSLMAEFTKTLKMWRGVRIASGSKCRIKILLEYGRFMYQSTLTFFTPALLIFVLYFFVMNIHGTWSWVWFICTMQAKWADKQLNKEEIPFSNPPFTGGGQHLVLLLWS